MAETIHSQCACGQQISAVIFERRQALSGRPSQQIRFYVYSGPPAARTAVHVTRCPKCDRDFSQVTPEQFKEQVWQ